jgi:hypothetical protein
MNQTNETQINAVIEYRIKSVYGRDNWYVVSEHKNALEALTGTKTLTIYAVDALRALGFEFKQVL